jgi:2-aminoethylphosphonate-pyruvate transaminase
MKAIILAGGQNNRLSESIDIPKSILKFKGEPILLRQIEFLKKEGLSEEDIFVITGYKHEMIESLYKNTIFNENYKETNNGYGVYLGLKKILSLKNIDSNEEILIIDGDLIYDNKLIRLIFDSNKKNFLVSKKIDYSCSVKDEIFLLDKNNEISQMIIPSKKTPINNFNPNKNLFVYMGILKINLEKSKVLMNSLKNKEFWNSWYTIPLIDIINKGGFYSIILPEDLKFYFEIDDKNDYQKLQDLNQTHSQKNYKMFVAGPVNVSNKVKKSLVYSEIGHRESEFLSLFKEIKEKLLYVFGVSKFKDEYSTVIIGGSGTSATETLLSSVLHDDKKTLIVINGAFGERISEICNIYKIPTICLDYGWNGYPNLKEIEKKLIENKNIEAVAMVLMETSTGALNPIHETGKLCKKYNKIFIVDAISSLGGEKLNMKEDNIDYCLTNTNKCLGGLPVLGIICFNKFSIKKSKDIKPRSYSLDFFKHIDYSKKNQTPFTPPIPLYYMLKQALNEIIEEGLENRLKRYKKNGKLLKKELKKMGLKFSLKEEYTSNLMVNVIIPKNLNYEEIHKKMKEKKYIFYPGKGPLKDKVIHIANIGTLNIKDIKKFCKEFKNVLISLEKK